MLKTKKNYYAHVTKVSFVVRSNRTVKPPIMKKLCVLPILLIALNSFGQTSDNEILRVAELRQQCVERSKCVVKAYPNPSQGVVHIEAPNGATCRVISTNGTYVGTWEVGINGLDLTDLPTGNYIATVSYNSINRITRLVIL